MYLTAFQIAVLFSYKALRPPGLLFHLPFRSATLLKVQFAGCETEDGSGKGISLCELYRTSDLASLYSELYRSLLQ